MHEDDRNLVTRMLAGEQRAFKQFFDDYFPRLFRFALRRTDHDAEAARDIVQSTLLKGVHKLETYRAEASLFTWFCQIARHEFSDQYARQQARGRALLALENDPSVRATLESMEWVQDAEPGAAIARGEAAHLVHAALDYLPPRYAALLEMKYVDEMPVEKIADRLGVTTISVQSLLARARAAFREAHGALTEGLHELGIGP